MQGFKRSWDGFPFTQNLLLRMPSSIWFLPSIFFSSTNWYISLILNAIWFFCLNCFFHMFLNKGQIDNFIHLWTDTSHVLFTINQLVLAFEEKLLFTYFQFSNGLPQKLLIPIRFNLLSSRLAIFIQCCRQCLIMVDFTSIAHYYISLLSGMWNKDDQYRNPPNINNRDDPWGIS